jgi:hypothetical protein
MKAVKNSVTISAASQREITEKKFNPVFSGTYHEQSELSQAQSRNNLTTSCEYLTKAKHDLKCSLISLNKPGYNNTAVRTDRSLPGTVPTGVRRPETGVRRLETEVKRAETEAGRPETEVKVSPNLEEERCNHVIRMLKENLRLRTSDFRLRSNTKILFIHQILLLTFKSIQNDN